MKTTLEIPDPTFRKAKATASALGIPLREFVAQALEEKPSGGSQTSGKAWLECAGELAHLHKEMTRIQKIIEEEIRTNRARRPDLIPDAKALSAYLDETPVAVEIISEASELAIPVIVAGEFAFGIAQSRHRRSV